MGGEEPSSERFVDAEDSATVEFTPVMSTTGERALCHLLQLGGKRFGLFFAGLIALEYRCEDIVGLWVDR